MDWPCCHVVTPCSVPGSKITPTRFRFGSISCNSSSFLPNSTVSGSRTPVTFPPGFAKLSTRPAFTGSTIVYATIGTSAVAFIAARVAFAYLVTITSGFQSRASATTSGRCRPIRGADWKRLNTMFSPSSYPIVSRTPLMT